MAELIHADKVKRTRFQEEPRYQGGLYSLEQNTYAWLVPNGSWGEANAGLVVGDDEALLIDTLWDVPYTQQMLDAMQSLTKNAPIKTVINTHADGDHFFGNELLADRTIITSLASYQEMLTVKPSAMVALARIGSLLSKIPFFKADQAGHWFQNMVAPYDFAAVTHTPANQTFEGETTLDIGGREIHLIEVGPAHTLGDLIVYVPDTKILYSADILFIGSTPVMWAGPIENWLAALDRILAMDVEQIVPGHGPLTDKEGVRQVKRYWEYIVERLRNSYDGGLSEVDAASKIVLNPDYQKQVFGNWNSPERIMTNTYTLYRQWQGRKDHPSVPELVNILRKQAILAHQLPDAQPAIMRKST